MGNPYPANFETPAGAGRLTGQIYFTDPGNQPGGSSYTPPTAAAHYEDATSCANNADTNLAWTFSDGTALLNLAAPTLPTVVTAGIYAVTARFTTADGFAGKSAQYELDLDLNGFDFTTNAVSFLDASDYGGTVASLSLTGYCPAGAVIRADCYQDSGGALNVFMRAFVQRIT